MDVVLAKTLVMVEEVERNNFQEILSRLNQPNLLTCLAFGVIRKRRMASSQTGPSVVPFIEPGHAERAPLWAEEDREFSFEHVRGTLEPFKREYLTPQRSGLDL